MRTEQIAAIIYQTTRPHGDARHAKKQSTPGWRTAWKAAERIVKAFDLDAAE